LIKTTIILVKGKLLLGPILAIFGGILFIFSSFQVYQALITIGYNLSDAGLHWFEVGLYPELLLLGYICTILWGVLGIIGGIIAIFGKKSGNIIVFVIGNLGLFGALIPLGTNIAVTQIPLTLTGSFFLLDPILMIIGGALGLNSS
jgi:hypothetical protein